MKKREQAKIKKFQRILLSWAEISERRFSWRKTNNPYWILTSEILLQKTGARAVQLVYDRFIKEYPSVDALAQADLRRLKAIIKPLGLLHRARRMKRMAGEIMTRHDGKIPRTKGELLSLNGVGDYIASAVLCFAFGKPEPIVDTNVVRILRRVFGFRSKKAQARTDERTWEYAKKILPRGKEKKFNRAVLDFASLVCGARDPKCAECPVKDICSHNEKRRVRG